MLINNTHAECNHSSKINRMTISRYYNVIFLKDGGHNLENAGCDSAPVWRMQAVTWLLSGGCRLYIGSCLEDADCILVPVWRMQTVTWFLSGECRL